MYLSEELSKEYFGQERKTYQDSIGVTSKLESLEIYSKEPQNSILEGIAVTHYKSKQDNQDWNKGMNIFRVLYNSEAKKFTRIDNLGSGYSLAK